MKFDEIGCWSEVKLKIIRKYASAYSRIIEKQRKKGLLLEQMYIDGFAGGGFDIARDSKEVVKGSPAVALGVKPPFRSFHFVDLDGMKAGYLRELTIGVPAARVYEGDCNEILLRDILPLARFENYCRALCLLDPYGLHLDWSVIQMAGQMRSVEIFLNFPIMDMNRNVLLWDRSAVDPDDKKRMNAFWGDESWNDVAYDGSEDLFGHPEKQSNAVIAEAFRQRLGSLGGFKFVRSHYR